MKATLVLPVASKVNAPAAVPPWQQQDLSPVEEGLKQLLTSSQRAASLGSRLALSGGKRLRPRLCLLAYRHSSGNQSPSPRVYKLATAIELLHLATLLHDDVIDNATRRRLEPSINVTHGNKTAVLLGDFFFSCFLEAAAGSSSDVLSLLAGTIGSMVEGELTQAHHRLNLGLTEKEYLNIIERKTAALIAAACEVGARAAEANTDTIKTFQRFGLSLGCAFQIQDDILDYVGSPDRLGKSLYSDLKEGIVTLPLIYTLKHNAHKARLTQLLLDTGLTTETVALIAAQVRQAGGIEYAQSRAQLHLNAARQALMALSPSSARTELEWMLLTLAQRER